MAARDRASRPEARPQRLFIAVEVPAEVREALAVAVAPMRSALSGARWVPSANQHLTLKFLGSTWPRLVPVVEEAVADVAARHGRFTVALQGLGAFPGEGRARVLWAGIRDPAGRLSALAADLDAALAGDFTPESRGYSPHLTLARLRPPSRVEAALAAAQVPDLAFEVGELVLFRSHLGRPAPRYEILAREELAPPP
jgi:2'-5' RNA ligase